MGTRRSTKKIGRLIRDARMTNGITQKDLAAKLGVRSGSYVGMLESGLCKGVGLDRLREIAGLLDVHGVETYRWMAAAGHLPLSLLQALMRAPERWDEVIDMLGGHSRSSAPKSRRRLRA
jgi:transcriptional regulator with XRE-family HTH domain